MTNWNRRRISVVLAAALALLAVPVANAASADHRSDVEQRRAKLTAKKVREKKELRERQKAYRKAMQVRKDKEDSVRALVSQSGEAGIDAARRIAFSKHPDSVVMGAIFNGLQDRPPTPENLRQTMWFVWDLAHHFYNSERGTTMEPASGSFAGVFHYLHRNEGYVQAAAKVNDPANSDLDRALYLRVFEQAELNNPDHPYRKLALETYRPYLDLHGPAVMRIVAIKVAYAVWDYDMVDRLSEIAKASYDSGALDAVDKFLFWGPDPSVYRNAQPKSHPEIARLLHGGPYDPVRYKRVMKEIQEAHDRFLTKMNAESERRAIEAAKQREASRPATGEAFARPEPVEGSTTP